MVNSGSYYFSNSLLLSRLSIPLQTQGKDFLGLGLQKTIASFYPIFMDAKIACNISCSLTLKF